MKVNELIREKISEINDQAILLDGFDDAIIGVSSEGYAVYSIQKIHEILCADHGMTIEEAIEYAEFNIIYVYFESNTPIYINYI